MSEYDEHLERLITRRLDGELTPEEDAELGQILRARPAARQLLAEHAACDRLAGLALRQSLGAPRPCPGVPIRHIGRRREWLSYSLVAAAAACIAMVMLFRGQWSPPTPADRLAVSHTSPVDGQWLRNASHAGLREPTWTTPIDYPHRQSRLINRNVFGIKDPNTGRYFILEYRQQAVKTVPVRGSL
jgi:anti-sigma factor RsiW